MPKRTSKSSGARAIVLLAVLSLVLFVTGEVVILARSDAGRITAAKYLHLGDRAEVTRLIGRQIRLGLEASGVTRDSIRETVVEGGQPPLRWRVGIAPDGSLLQTNHAITRAVEDQGAEILSGREHPGRLGVPTVTLKVGFRGRPTHEVLLVRQPVARAEEPSRTEGRLAIVLFGFGDDVEATKDLFQLRHPFAVALPAGGPDSPELFRAARAADREVVLHLPLEPINYPQVNPGPGTILVTMDPNRVTGLVRRYLDQSGPVTAVANLMGSLATQDMTVMSAVYQELRRRRVPFLHVTPAAGAVCKSLASDLGVAYEEPDVVIDGEARQSSPRALESRWKQVVKQAHERGEVLVMVRATPLAIEWLPGALAAKRLDGASVVPVSALLRKPPL